MDIKVVSNCSLLYKNSKGSAVQAFGKVHFPEVIKLNHILELCLPNHHIVRGLSSAVQNLRLRKIGLSPENF